MADAGNDSPAIHPVAELAGNAAGLLFELRIAAAAIHFGLQTLAAKPDSASLKEELAVLHKLSNQSCDALEVLQRVITEHLAREA